MSAGWTESSGRLLTPTHTQFDLQHPSYVSATKCFTGQQEGRDELLHRESFPTNSNDLSVYDATMNMANSLRWQLADPIRDVTNESSGCGEITFNTISEAANQIFIDPSVSDG